MVRFIVFFIIMMSLSACNFNITPTFYIRDIQDVISDKKNIEIIIKSAIENELIFTKTGLYILINFYFFVI